MADKKLTELSELTTLDDNDLTYVVDDPGGTAVSKKVKLSTLMGFVRLNGAPTVDATYEGIVITGVSYGETITQFDLVYMDATENEWMKADANAAGKFPAVGMAVTAGDNGDVGTVLVLGVVKNTGWTFSDSGVAVYLSETAGGITETQPSDSGDCIQHIGRVLSAANCILLVHPNTLWVEHD